MSPYHVALASAYPTEATARAAAEDLPDGLVGEYRGLWRIPVPERTIVHLFTDKNPTDLTALGWEQVSTGEE